MVPLLLVGCIFVTDAELGARLEALPGPLRVQSVEPDWGQTGTRALVTISGGDFDSGTQVFFGEQAANILSYGDHELQLEVEPPNSVGRVEITIRRPSDQSEFAVPQPFTWFGDESGKTGLVGLLQTYAGPAAPEKATQAWMEFTTETEGDLLERVTAPVTGCGPYPYEGQFAASALDVGAGTVRLNSPDSGTPLDLNSTETGEFQGEFDLPLVVSRYDLASTDTEGLPVLSAEGLFQVPEPVTGVEPSLGGGFGMARDDFALNWVGLDAGNQMVVRLTGGGVSTLCATDDDGNLRVPWESLDGWTSGQALTVEIGRIQPQSGVLPWNGADWSTVSVSWMAGTVQMQ